MLFTHVVRRSRTLIRAGEFDRFKVVRQGALDSLNLAITARDPALGYGLIYGNTLLLGERMSLDRELLTSVGRLLLTLGRAGGRATFTEARRAVGSQIYYALRQAGALGLIVEEEGGKVIKLTERGRAVAECLVRCFGSSSSGTR